ncbi:isochorismatase family protein [Xylophilus sp.]|uniref:isochorismatase family protein n=1 Tax=Xylophilus sp. TaxID=2653893 RepID=UPI0013BC14CF|nr:isochorismatase family protein [Xylophilus sp.]KAF1050205.1 MAG: putative hydrolase YcaC [Xylophilus sp.]
MRYGVYVSNTVEATGRKQLIIAGVVTKVCVAFPALSAIEGGFDVCVITDAFGTFDPMTRDAAWNRMTRAGVQLPDYRSLITTHNLLAQGR